MIAAPVQCDVCLLYTSDTENAPFVVVINQSMARQYFGDQSPLGKHLQLGALPDDQTPWMEIVGVVGDMKQSLDAGGKSEMYIPYRQANTVLPLFSLSVVLRTAGEPHSAAGALRAVVRRLDPSQPLVKIRTMEENISTSVSAPRFRATLLGIFAGSALLLAVIGLYGDVYKRQPLPWPTSSDWKWRSPVRPAGVKRADRG